MAHKSDSEIIQTTHNTARFFTENRHISWVLLIAVIFWGVYGYMKMPKRKDPIIPVRIALATCPWPGASADQIEQLVTREMEDTIAENLKIHKPKPGSEFGITSLTLPGIAIVRVQLAEDVSDTVKEFNDINLRLNAMNQNLPPGAGPIQFNDNYGDTAALMLTVAIPKESTVEIALRARNIKHAINEVRSQAASGETGSRATLIVALPQSINPQTLERLRDLLAQSMIEKGIASDIRPVQGPGFIGLDAMVRADDAAFLDFVKKFGRDRLGLTGFHPDAWDPTVIRNPEETESRLQAVAGDKYTYRQLDDFTELMERTLENVPQVSTVQRSGVLPQQIYLEYSQVQLASYGLQPTNIKPILNARNTTVPGGVLQIENTNVLIEPSGQFTSAEQIGDVIITKTSSGIPVYLRDLVEITRGYQSPPRFLNFYTWQDSKGEWHRSRAVTVAAYMRTKEQIGQLGDTIDKSLEDLKQRLPEDLIIAKTSDQPRQVRENVDLFMNALVEAIILVVIVSLIGFWEWRSALIMAFSIPITLAMTFGMMYVLGIDLQQVSIASLIVALGLLVDDPVVAGDAIKRDLASGHPPIVASWLGPTKLARAIVFATITNIAAYLPFLLLTGNSGYFLYSLPIVLACALVSSRIVSMTFVPLFGYYLLRPHKKHEPTIEELRKQGFTGLYYRIGTWVLKHRWKSCAASIVFLGLGIVIMSRLHTSFFPNDVQYWSYLDVWLPNDAPLSTTNEAAIKAEGIIRRVTEEYGKQHPDRKGKPRKILQSITTFVGGGGPRFWFSVTPQPQQLNYAQVIIQVTDKDDTPRLAGPLQLALLTEIPGTHVEVQQLQINPVSNPIEIEISGRADISSLQQAEDIRTLRVLSGQVKDIFRSIPKALIVFDDWDEESFVTKLEVDPDRANLAGISNQDVAGSSAAGISGAQLTNLYEGDKQIPVVAQLRIEERAQLSDIQNLYVYASENTNKVPLLEVSSIRYDMETQRIQRREHFRTITVISFPAPGVLASEVFNAAEPQLKEFIKGLPPGYKVVIGGERAKQQQGFKNLAQIMAISVTLIFLALVVQFNNAVKPLLVFAAIPFGMVGALAALYIMGSPFSFMAFLGMASLVGVIISHVIVLFDFIEQNHEKGEPLFDSLLDAGIVRLRPIMITVGATLLALVPLAVHGGPLWQPLCYAQIGGLALATFIELLLVKVFYAIFVLDLRIVKWESKRLE
jgi:multidrug efflux pump subunit AcrB